MHTYTCARILFGGLSIGFFIKKLPIAKIYSMPIFRLTQYIKMYPTLKTLQVCAVLEEFVKTLKLFEMATCHMISILML